MTDLPTPRDYAGIHRVDAVCPACDRWHKLDLIALIQSGHGDVPLVKLPLRCSGCGASGHKIIVSGRSYPGFHAQTLENFDASKSSVNFPEKVPFRESYQASGTECCGFQAAGGCLPDILFGKVSRRNGKFEPSIGLSH
jgi:hypothetical protein